MKSPFVFALVAVAVAGVVLSGCRPKEVQALLAPSEALGSVLADEAARLAGGKKQVALITHDGSWGQASTAEEALRAALKKQGVELQVAKAANLGNPMSGPVGLKAPDFVEALDKSRGAGAVVSLVGAPLLTDGELAQLKPDHPPVLVVATASLGDKMGVHTDAVQLARLLEAKVIELAIIDGADPAGAAPGEAGGKRDLFAQHYRILRRPN